MGRPNYFMARLYEALNAKFDPDSKMKPYGKEEFDKLWPEYDVGSYTTSSNQKPFQLIKSIGLLRRPRHPLRARTPNSISRRENHLDHSSSRQVGEEHSNIYLVLPFLAVVESDPVFQPTNLLVAKNGQIGLGHFHEHHLARQWEERWRHCYGSGSESFIGLA